MILNAKKPELPGLLGVGIDSEFCLCDDYSIILKGCKQIGSILLWYLILQNSMEKMQNAILWKKLLRGSAPNCFGFDTPRFLNISSATQNCVKVMVASMHLC